MKRKFMVSALGALCVLAVGGVFTALAAGGYGSQDDPLVTLSYITDVAVPEANARIDSVFSQKETAIKSDIQSKMDSVRSQLESQISQLQNVSQDVINQVVELVKREHDKAVDILTANREKLDRLAAFLYEKETITGEEFMHILGE